MHGLVRERGNEEVKKEAKQKKKCKKYTHINLKVDTTKFFQTLQAVAVVAALFTFRIWFCTRGKTVFLSLSLSSSHTVLITSSQGGGHGGALLLLLLPLASTSGRGNLQVKEQLF
jgi:hypothetical protein